MFGFLCDGIWNWFQSSFEYLSRLKVLNYSGNQIGFGKLCYGVEFIDICIFLVNIFSFLLFNETYQDFFFFHGAVLWPPGGESIPISVSYLNNKKSFMFWTQTNIEFPIFLLPSSLENETLRTLHKFSGSDKIAYSNRNEKSSLKHANEIKLKIFGFNLATAETKFAFHVAFAA